MKIARFSDRCASARVRASLGALLCLVISLSAASAQERGDSPRGDPIKVEVLISGIDEALLANARAFLSIAELERDTGVSRLTSLGRGAASNVSESDVRRRHRAAPEQIREALMPFGHYLVSVESELEPTADGFRATYRVDPGEPARLRDVDVRVSGEGADFGAVRDALASVQLAPSQVLRHAEYEAVKSRLYDAAYNNGFLDARWQASQLSVSPDRHSADITLALDTGPRFYFGEVTIEQSVIDANVMADYVAIAANDPYDVNRLLDLQRVLNETGYFSKVELRAGRGAADAEHRVPVTVITEPARPQKWSVGLGYGTDTGPRTTVGMLMRRVNERGHRLRADLQLSSIEQVIGTRYDIPVRNRATDLLSFSATARTEEIGDAETEQFAAGISHVVSWLGFRRRLYLQAEREQFSFGDGPAIDSDLVYPGVTLTRERADNVQFVRRGYSVRADLRAGSESVLSSVAFSRLELTHRWAREIAPRTRFLARAEAGVLRTNDFDALPPSQRFFTGGDRSIRGYAFREVGPRDAGGNVIGGKRMFAVSAEAERLFAGNFGAAVFVDAGDAFDDRPDLKLGAGLGARWRSPIGMVRLDIARPLDDPDNDYRIHLTIGADL
jgi:translocation and assembly module TamA